MLKNINITNGIFFSQRVLLELTYAGFTREQSYKIVQENAMKAWKENSSFYDKIVSDKKIGSSLDIFCEGENQDKEKFWIRLNRNSEDIDTGIGHTTYLYGSGKYSKFVDLKCKYASKIFGVNAILTQKCKI